MYKKPKIRLKKKYNKPGNVFLGLVHRLDRPTSGVIVFARTSKALSRLNEQFRVRKVSKIYWALVKKDFSPPSNTLVHWIVRNPEKNRSSISVADHFEKKSKKKIVEEKPLLDIKRLRRPKKSLLKRFIDLFKSSPKKQKVQKRIYLMAENI